MREYLLKKQPTWGLRRAQGTGQKSATPATLTKIILVLLTMILLPSAAWGQISVAGNASTGGTITGSGITGTVTFNAETSTLTLNNATIAGSISYSGTDALTIALIGGSTMTCTSSNKAFESGNEVSLSFSTTSTDNGTLTISENLSSYDASDITTFSSGFTQISCSEGSGLVAVSQDLGTIYVSKSYYITVGGVSVTTDNENGITGGNITGTVKYVHDAETNSGTLLLTGVTITRSEAAAIIIPTSLRKLAINIQGVNTINTTDNYPVITSNRIDGKGTVEFSGTGSLTLKRGADYGITSLLTVDKNSYKDGLVPTYKEPATATSFEAAKEVLISTISYKLTVAGVGVTSANCGDILDGDNKGKVSFTPATIGADQASIPATLTLNGATINGDIVWDGSASAPLTIELAGMNTVINNAGDNDAVSAIRAESATSATTCPLTIAKKDDAESATLKLAGYNTKGGNADAFTNFNLSTELNNASVTSKGITYYYYTSEPTYDLTVAGIQVHGISGELGYRENVLQDRTVSFTPANEATLTLNGATLTAGIVTGMDMTIDLKGNNFITVNGGYALYGNGGTRTIIFTSSSDPVGNLTLKNSSGELAKFVTIQYDTNTGLVPTIITPSDASDLAAAKEAIIAKGTAMGITVAGVVVTNSNYTDIKGDGITGTKVSFTPANEATSTPATLTLDNASITGDIKFNASLTVHLVGDNTITKPDNISYAFDLGNTARDLNFSTDETEPGTLKIVGSYSGLQNDGIIYNGQIKGGSATIGTTGDDVIWKQTFITDATPSYFILSLNKHYNLWKNGHQYHDLILDNNDGYVFNPEESTLTIINSSSSDYINSGLEDLTIIVSGSRSLSHIAFGAPAGTQAEGITTGTLTITGKEDSESSSSINSLSLSNTGGGVITDFSKVTIKAPLHITEPEGFTGWTNAVTSATITDESDDNLLSDVLTEGVDYVTFYAADRDIYLSSRTPYVITNISGSSVVTKAISYIPKGTVAIVDKNSNTAKEAVTTGNMLKYAANAVTPTTSTYVLYNGKFTRASGSIPQGKCYLDLSGVPAAGTRGFYDIDGGDGTTAIKDVKSGEVDGGKWADGGWHDLQGRRLSAKPTKPGLYILNGKKVVIK